MNITKKIVATMIGLSMVLMAAPVVATENDIDELTAKYEELLAKYEELLAKFEALTDSTVPAVGVPAACVGVTFTANLTVGSSGANVKCLQALLNTNTATQVAAAGAGSPGAETIYFGPLTQAAVVRFQQTYAAEILTPLGLTAGTGFVGPKTIAKLNAMLIPPVTPPVDDDDDDDDDDVTPPVGEEGAITVTMAASPASNANVVTNVDVPVYGLNIKAIGSDMTVQRLDIQAAVTGGLHPGTLITQIRLYDGDTLLLEKPVSVADFVKISTNYYVRLVGFNFEVPKGTTKTLTVKIDTLSGLESDRQLTVNVYGNGIRAVDTLGLVTYDLSATTRVFTFKYTTINTSVLTATANVTTPPPTNVKVDSTYGATGVPMLLFNLKSTIGASKVTDVVILRIAGTTLGPSIISLYDGDTLIGAQTGEATTTFSNLEVNIAKDATKTLTVKADYPTTATNTSSTLALAAAGITYERPNLITIATANAQIDGYPMFLFDKVPVLTLSTPLTNKATTYETATTSNYAEGVITFKVKADGGLLTKFASVVQNTGTATTTASTIAVSVRDSAGAIVTTGTFSGMVQVVPDANVPDGSEATVTITATFTRGATAVGLMYFQVDQINWVIDGASAVNQSWGLTTYKTPVASVK